MSTIRVSQLAVGSLAGSSSYFCDIERINALYCRTHGYDYTVERLENHTQYRLNRHSAWEKVGHLRRHLQECDFLLHLDVNSFFYNHVLSVREEWLSRLGAKLLYGAASGTLDEQKADKVHFNALLIRNTEQAHKLLKKWDESSEMPGNAHLRYECNVDQCGVSHVFKDDILIELEYPVRDGLSGQLLRNIGDIPHRERERFMTDLCGSQIMCRNCELRL